MIRHTDDIFPYSYSFPSCHPSLRLFATGQRLLKTVDTGDTHFLARSAVPVVAAEAKEAVKFNDGSFSGFRRAAGACLQ